MRKITAFLTVCIYCITCISFQDKYYGMQGDRGMKIVGNFNGGDPAFVTYTRKGDIAEEEMIAKVVASSDKTSKQDPVSYASYAVDNQISTRWQSVKQSGSDTVSITFTFDGDRVLSKMKINAPTFPKTLKITYTTEKDKTPQEASVGFIKKGKSTKEASFNGIVANSITLTASGLDNIYGGKSYGFELSEVEFYTTKNIPVKEVLPENSYSLSNPFNQNAYKVSDNGSITIKLYNPNSIFRIGVKSDKVKNLKNTDIFYIKDGEEVLLHEVEGLTGTTDIQYFEFDPVYTDTFILKGLNACEIYNILLYKWDTDSASWAATDGLGRSIATYEDINSAKRQNKEVGIFYFLSHAKGTKNEKYYDVTKVLEAFPDAMETGRGFGPYMTYHWWGEPAFGFYTQTDEWVIRKDAQMLSDAGVDFLILDLSNFKAGSPETGFKDEINTLCNVFRQIRREGGKTPKFMFFMPPLAPNSVAAFDFWWENMYKDGTYEELWYKWDNGKPVALTFKDQIQGTRYVDFFEIRDVQHAITPFYTIYKDDWQWVSAYPQGYGYSDEYPVEAMNASPAQNVTWNITDEIFQKYKPVGYHIGFSIGYDKETKTTVTRGRDYTGSKTDFSGGSVANAENLERAIYEGWNFREQLERVLNKDPRVTFITGWNEWTMYRIPGTLGVNGVTDPNGFFFWDQFNYRYNRDIQPLAYHYKDATYYQMVDFIRQYKGSSPVKEAKPMSISINTFNDWLKVENVYYDDIGDITYRNTANYANVSGRNDIIMSKVSYDEENIYFYVKTKEDITSYTDPSWMRLFIRTEGKGWEGYDYILNKTSPSGTKAKLEKFADSSWESTLINEVDYFIKGREMQVRISRSMLGLTESMDFEFKWHDNMQTQGEALDFTTNGDAAPNGRFNYVFRGNTESNRKISLKPLFLSIIGVSLLTIVLALIYDLKRAKK